MDTEYYTEYAVAINGWKDINRLRELGWMGMQYLSHDTRRITAVRFCPGRFLGRFTHGDSSSVEQYKDNSSFQVGTVFYSVDDMLAYFGFLDPVDVASLDEIL